MTNSVPVPQNVDQARAMALTGMKWLEDNAPDQIIRRPGTVGAQQSEANSCPECGSDDTTWQCLLAPNSGAPTDGRLRLSDVSVVFYRGCNHCSETLEALTEGEIAERLNTQPPSETAMGVQAETE